MIGTVLKFESNEGGLLRGEDGRRYVFHAADWPGDTPPEPGMTVDFEPEDDRALDLCPLPGPSPETVVPAPDAAEWFAARPGLPLALLLLIACFLPFLTLGPLSANLFNVVSVASSLGRYAPVNVNMETGLWLFHFLHVVPACAALLILLEWRGLAGRWWRIGIGLVGLLGPVAIALGARALFTASAPSTSLGARLARKAREYVAPEAFVPQIGIGWAAIAFLSIALIAAGIFWSASPKERN